MKIMQKIDNKTRWVIISLVIFLVTSYNLPQISSKYSGASGAFFFGYLSGRLIGSFLFGFVIEFVISTLKKD